MNPLITPAEAESLISSALPTLTAEAVALEDADRRILRQGLTADRPLPPYDRVMMDGICFRSGQASKSGDRLAIRGLHAAGDPPPDALPPGHCWEVMTGAQLPPDCDTVVPYEEVQQEASVAVLAADVPPPGTHIHRAGSDFAAGAELAPAGLPVSARVAAVAATVGATMLQVTRLPRILVLTTGDELVPPSEDPAPHQVRRSNDAALRAALHAWGPGAVNTAHLPDCESRLNDFLATALQEHDLILSCGGISKGKRDHLRPVLENLVGAPAFHGISQRPGKPLAFWSGPVPVFTLPGNPMSVLVCFHRYVLPALNRMTAREPVPVRQVLLTEAFQFNPPLTFFLPVALTADGRATPRPLQNSGDFASAVDSTGFIELHPGETTFPAGHSAPYFEWL